MPEIGQGSAPALCFVPVPPGICDIRATGGVRGVGRSLGSISPVMSGREAETFDLCHKGRHSRPESDASGRYFNAGQSIPR